MIALLPVSLSLAFLLSSRPANQPFDFAPFDFAQGVPPTSQPANLPPAPPITALAFTPDGRQLVSGSQAGVEVRSWPDLRVLRRLPTQLVQVHDLAFSPDGLTLAVGGGEPGVSGSVESVLWPDALKHQTVSAHKDLVYAVAWYEDSRFLMTAGMDQVLHRIDMVSRNVSRDYEGHARGVLAVCLLPGKQGFVSAGIDESLRLWSDNGTLVRTFSNHTRPVYDLALRPESDPSAPPMIASAGEDRTVRLWQPTTGRMMRFVRLKSAPLAIEWSRKAAAILAACADGHLRVIDPDTVEVLRDLPAIKGVAYSLAVATHDNTAAVGGEGGEVVRIEL